jgi:hypothetical protein
LIGLVRTLWGFSSQDMRDWFSLAIESRTGASLPGRKRATHAATFSEKGPGTLAALDHRVTMRQDTLQMGHSLQGLVMHPGHGKERLIFSPSDPLLRKCSLTRLSVARSGTRPEERIDSQ